METAQEMRKRHNQELEKLQKECNHPKISDWMPHYWAPGHSTGFEVKHCEICDKVVARRTACRKCRKVTEEYKEGTGTHSRPFGTHYCPDCIERTADEIKEDEKSDKQMAALGKKGKWY